MIFAEGYKKLMSISDRHSACSDSGVERNSDVRKWDTFRVVTLGIFKCFQSALMVNGNGVI